MRNVATSTSSDTKWYQQKHFGYLTLQRYFVAASEDFFNVGHCLMVAQLSNAANSRECAVKDAREKDRDGVIVHPSCAGVVRSCAAIERGSKSQKLGVQILSFLDELVHRGHSDFGILIVARVHIRSRPFRLLVRVQPLA